MFHYYVGMDEWISFEDVMIRLRLMSSELHNLVTTGKLQTTFRDGRILFRQADVDAFQRRLIAPPPLPEPPPRGPTPQSKLIKPKKKVKRGPKKKAAKKKRAR